MTAYITPPQMDDPCHPAGVHYDPVRYGTDDAVRELKAAQLESLAATPIDETIARYAMIRAANQFYPDRSPEGARIILRAKWKPKISVRAVLRYGWLRNDIQWWLEDDVVQVIPNFEDDTVSIVEPVFGQASAQSFDDLRRVMWLPHVPRPPRRRPAARTQQHV